ncbi:MAG TPA: hypothetical protein VHC44_11365 [Verrucomicrobiae bacterium]|nr:hypothetical protein [Verrucomicrobiae bacterium]
MNSTAIILAISSTSTFVLSLLAWKLTSSRSIVFNGLLGSLAILLAAYFALTHDTRNLPLTYIIPFVVAMAFLGRGIGLVSRVKREPDLKTPSYYLFTAGAISLVASVVAYISFR